MAAEFFLHKSSPTYINPENADVMSISQFMAQNLRQPPPIPPPPKHTFEISEGESVEIEKIVAAEKKEGQLYYKVKWVKYTWEAEESIQHLPHLIDGYWREHFYQNINQAAIDTTGINLVNNDADFQTRNKSVVINTTDSRDVHKQAEAMVAEKLTSPDPTHGVNNNGGNSTVDHSDVILEFTMQQQKHEHAYQNRIPSLTMDKKPRRSQPLERKYICQVCDKAFDRNTSLTRHILTHTREKPFKCQLCEKAFSQNAHLKRHILIHIGQKSYQCNKCGKMFIEKGGLARHEATHSTEKPWVCNQCGKSFVLNEYLQRHLFLHTGQKPYQCNECGRLFADGSSWRAHKLTHSKEKKYKCQICQKMLKCKRNFKKHVQAHSDDKDLKHQCDVCDQRFPNKKTLKEHIKKGKRAHSCAVCKMYMESKQIFLSHRLTHDPNSATYNPNPKMYEIEEDDDDDDEEDVKTVKSDMDESNSKTEEFENSKSDTESMDENEQEEEGLEDILESTQESSSQDSTAASDSQTEVPSTFTTLILKPEDIEQAATTGEEVDEEEIEEQITSNIQPAPINLTEQQQLTDQQLNSAFNSAVKSGQLTQDLSLGNVVTLPVVIDGVISPRLNVVPTPTLSAVDNISNFIPVTNQTLPNNVVSPIPALPSVLPPVVSSQEAEVAQTIILINQANDVNMPPV